MLLTSLSPLLFHSYAGRNTGESPLYSVARLAACLTNRRVRKMTSTERLAPRYSDARLLSSRVVHDNCLSRLCRASSVLDSDRRWFCAPHGQLGVRIRSDCVGTTDDRIRCSIAFCRVSSVKSDTTQTRMTGGAIKLEVFQTHHGKRFSADHQN